MRSVRHPGPAPAQRRQAARGNCRKISVTLTKGGTLLQAVAAAMEGAGCTSGVMVVDGLQTGPFDYVMPGPSDDGVHAAWYSATHHCAGARIRHGTASIGRKDGAWWLHCHAVWDRDEGGCAAGHLLPGQVILAAEATVTLLAFDGGVFDVADDAETMFPIFGVTGGRTHGNALLVRVRPFEDIHTAVSDLIRDAGFARAEVYGIGSLIGAVFTDAAEMASPISEVLILPGAAWNGHLHLPMHCVDPDGGQFQGTIRPGGAPVCVTFELLVLSL